MNVSRIPRPFYRIILTPLCCLLPLMPLDASGAATRSIGQALELAAADDTTATLARLQAIAAADHDSVWLVFPLVQDASDSSFLYSRTGLTPSEAQIESAIEAARALGLRPALAPRIAVDSPEEVAAPLAPRDPGAWWRSYAIQTARYARLAEESGANAFGVGFGAIGLEAESARWRRLIAALRRDFSGQIWIVAEPGRNVPASDLPVAEIGGGGTVETQTDGGEEAR